MGLFYSVQGRSKSAGAVPTIDRSGHHIHGIMRTILLSLTLLLKLGWAAAAPGVALTAGDGATAKKRYAYATIHYEGTKNDDAYVLGIRTLIASVRERGNEEDFLCLVTPNVRQSTREAFTRDGCILREVGIIENPYADHVKAHFLYTLIKLHLWNQLDYDRLVYMDADNIALGKLGALFACGHFCAEFMNPVNFHTGLLVIKPSAETYAAMLRALHDPKVQSYDGADQGFLTAFFPYERMINAPLFSERECVPKGGCEHELNRLPVGYNLNAFWFYEKGHWGLYRQHDMPWSDAELPGITLAFCVPPWLKPWFWWSHMLMDTNWRLWHEKRLLLHEEDAMVLPLYVAPAALLLVLVGVAAKQLARFSDASIVAFANKSGFAMGCGIVTVYSALTLTFKIVPALINPREGWELFIILHTVLLACFVMTFKALFGVHEPARTACDVAPVLALQLFNAYTSYYKMYPVMTVHVGRLATLAGIFVVWVSLQLRIFVNFGARQRAAKVRPTSSTALPMSRT
eukprot:g3823.t1